LTEVLGRLARDGRALDEALDPIEQIGIAWMDFDRELAVGGAALLLPAAPWGLSLGDRACLALTRLRNLPAVTADRAWAKLDLGISIEVDAEPRCRAGSEDPAMSPPPAERLYEADFYAWTQTQAKELRRFARTRPAVPLDVAHLAKEIQDLGRRRRGRVQPDAADPATFSADRALARDGSAASLGRRNFGIRSSVRAAEDPLDSAARSTRAGS
jgi:hypothetical protein